MWRYSYCKSSFPYFDEIDGYIKESNGNKYLIFASTNKNKEEVLTKYTEHWNKIKNLIETKNDKPGEYEKGFIKTKFDSEDNLPLNRILRNWIIFVKVVFQEDTKYYPQFFFRWMFAWIIKTLKY